jgi:hypothetical protein
MSAGQLQPVVGGRSRFERFRIAAVPIALAAVAHRATLGSV